MQSVWTQLIVGMMAIALLVGAGAPASAVQPVDDFKITAINAKTGVVTAAGAKGQTVHFKVGDATLLWMLKIGQTVYANLAAKTVSLRPDGIAPCCGIVSGQPPEGMR